MTIAHTVLSYTVNKPLGIIIFYKLHIQLIPCYIKLKLSLETVLNRLGSTSTNLDLVSCMEWMNVNIKKENGIYMVKLLLNI